jgi:glycosyltransferase involved in cell wall biosynthesis
MRVAYILSRFPYLTETFILREMLSLRRLGWEVHVFPLFAPLPTPVHEEAQEMLPYVHSSPFLLSGRLLLANLRFLVRSPARYARALATAIWQSYREPRVLLRVLLTFPKSVYFASEMEYLDIEQIHAHYVWVNGISARIVHDLIDVPYSLHPHAFGLFMREQEDVRRQLDLADGVVTIAEYHRQYIANLCHRWTAEEIAVVHCALDLEEFVPDHVTAKDGRVRILSVGSLRQKKGHEYLIDACAQLVKRGQRFHCQVVGDGPLRRALEERISLHGLEDHVSLLGPKTQKEIRDLYRHTDAFVLACVVARDGDRDGVPYSLMEAMAMEIPVITTPVTGIPELVRDGKTGLLVPERDSASLAQAMERLICDEALRHDLGRRGRQAVEAGFDVRATIPQLAAALQDIQRGSTMGSRAGTPMKPVTRTMREP